MTTEVSKIVVYDNGDILDMEKTMNLLFAYWQLSAAEKRSFDKLIIKYPVCPDKWKEQFENYLSQSKK